MEVDFNLAGKDFFTEKEAAHYCGVSPSQFRKKHGEYGITSSNFMGKRMYRKDDLRRALESSWRLLRNTTAVGQSDTA
jgi:hypothetical protein